MNPELFQSDLMEWDLFILQAENSLMFSLENRHPISWEPVLIYCCQNPRQQFDLL